MIKENEEKNTAFTREKAFFIRQAWVQISIRLCRHRQNILYVKLIKRDQYNY